MDETWEEHHCNVCKQYHTECVCEEENEEVETVTNIKKSSQNGLGL